MSSATTTAAPDAAPSWRERARRGAVGAAAGVVVTAAAWWALLGWDTHVDHQADGSQSGPYQAWQVALLLVVLAGLAGWLGLRGNWVIAPVAVALTLAVSLGVSAHLQDDFAVNDDGLWVVGVGLAFVGTYVAMLLVTGLITAVRTGRANGQTSVG